MSEHIREALRVLVEYLEPGASTEITEEQALQRALDYAKGYRDGVKSVEQDPEPTKQKHTERKGA